MAVERSPELRAEEPNAVVVSPSPTQQLCTPCDEHGGMRVEPRTAQEFDRTQHGVGCALRLVRLQAVSQRKLNARSGVLRGTAQERVREFHPLRRGNCDDVKGRRVAEHVNCLVAEELGHDVPATAEYVAQRATIPEVDLYV